MRPELPSLGGLGFLRAIGKKRLTPHHSFTSRFENMAQWWSPTVLIQRLELIISLGLRCNLHFVQDHTLDCFCSPVPNPHPCFPPLPRLPLLCVGCVSLIYLWIILWIYANFHLHELFCSIFTQILSKKDAPLGVSILQASCIHFSRTQCTTKKRGKAKGVSTHQFAWTSLSYRPY